MKTGSFLVLLSAIFLSSQVTYAQGTARILGVVTDSGGGLVPDAQVTLINDATGLREPPRPIREAATISPNSRSAPIA